MINFIKIDVKIKDSYKKPPFFMGSMLRGAFGHSLKKVVCINPTYSCEGCFVCENCIYYDLYELKNSFHLYRFDTNLAQKNWDFSLYIYESLTDKLPYILSAISIMLQEKGLGYKRDKFEIKSIYCNFKEIYSDGIFNLSNLDKSKIDYNYSKHILLKIKTPLRMKMQNRLLKQKPPLETLLQSIQNKLDEFKNQDKKRLSHTPLYTEVQNSIKFTDLTRFSNRQKTKMQLGGIIGEIEYDNLDEKSYNLLKIGEIMGVGKQSVFGLGKIEVEEIKY